MKGSAPHHLALFSRSLQGGGGAERVLVNLAREFVARGHRVDIVLARVDGHFVDSIPPEVDLVDLGSPAALAGAPSMLGTPGDLAALLPVLFLPGGARVLGAAPALARYLERRRPDALISVLNYSNIAALLAKRMVHGFDPRVLISVHNHLSVAAAEAAGPQLRAMPRLARRFFGAADHIVCVSNGVADDLAVVAGLPRETIATIYNPVVTPPIETLALRDPGHAWLKLGEPPVFLGAGKLKKQKDFVTLVRAFARVRANRTARLLILGEGDQRASLTKLAEELGVGRDVELRGFVDNPYAFMSRAAAFVLSSAWEGFGNVLVEAMACGCPVVSTDCPSGPAEILNDGEFGALVPVGDVEALASAMGKALDEPPHVENARDRAREFTAERSADQYLSLLDQPLAAGSRDANTR